MMRALFSKYLVGSTAWCSNTPEPSSTGYRSPSPQKRGGKKLRNLMFASTMLAVTVGTYFILRSGDAAPAAPAPPSVAVSTPLQRMVETQLQALGQFSAVDKVELRPQVGGKLTSINFKDGDIVKKDTVLFTIDPTQYQIKLAQAEAHRASARAKLNLGQQESKRAQELKTTGAGTQENVDQKVAALHDAKADLAAAEAEVRDAQFDLDNTKISAPFTGRIGTHQVSVGNLIAGSRAATSPTTLLTAIVSMDPIYLNFDMSEADYMFFLKERANTNGAVVNNAVAISLTGDSNYTRNGTLDFLDNSLDRSSGTIHARATVPNKDMYITPGSFGRAKIAVSNGAPALLVPDAAVLNDQDSHMVFTVGADNKVTPKQVTIGELRSGLRVITSGLAPNDQVIIDSIPTIRPGQIISPILKEITAGADDSVQPNASKTKLAANE
jgi:RND family efflux transporter MFP subunit